MLKIGLLTLFKQFPTQKVAGMISFSYICKQKKRYLRFTLSGKKCYLCFTLSRRERSCEMAK